MVSTPACETERCGSIPQPSTIYCLKVMLQKVCECCAEGEQHSCEFCEFGPEFCSNCDRCAKHCFCPQLVEACKRFIKIANIGCLEAIYQNDSVMKIAPGFIEEICDIIGYSKYEE